MDGWVVVRRGWGWEGWVEGGVDTGDSGFEKKAVRDLVGYASSSEETWST